jgi:hypothetical protein
VSSRPARPWAALGYEDLNDHDTLRLDPLLAVVAGKTDPLRENRLQDKGRPLAAPGTLNRLELSNNKSDRYHKISHDPQQIEQTLLEAALRCLPKHATELVLDLDCMGHLVHGLQKGRHLNAIAQILWGQQAKAPKAWRDLLEAANIARLLQKAGKTLPATGSSRQSPLKQLGYFENNGPQMCYAEYRKKKFFVGSGVVEAGCRTVIGERLKQSGMRRSVHGANAIIALRCCILSDRFEDFWASRSQ